MNKNSQVIGVVINYMQKELFIPVRPSNIKKEIEYVFFDETYTGLSFDETKNLYNRLKNITNNDLFLNIRAVILEDKMLVGLITETNQFVPVNPEVYDSLKINPDEEYKVIETGIAETKADSQLMDSDKDDGLKVVKLVELETTSYNAFRNVLKILLSDKKNRVIKNQLINYIEQNKIILEK